MTNDCGKLDSSEVSSFTQTVIRSNPTLTHSLCTTCRINRYMTGIPYKPRHLGLTFNPTTCSNNHLSRKILQIRQKERVQAKQSADLLPLLKNHFLRKRMSYIEHKLFKNFEFQGQSLTFERLLNMIF